ncbi:MAG: fumarylacetoacetate hydrolase family protein [Burkholderiales bacterium]|nr:fumarylacetoacetate hydrolase family protein [Burkholderiales bacterium]
MKLATYQDGSRDGQLIVVSRDLTQAHYASHIANRLQQVLDDWNYLSAQLQDLSDTLNFGKARHAFAFDPRQCMAPLPRAYQRLGCAAYPSHLELLQQANTEAGEAGVQTGLVQLGGDCLAGPHDAIECTDAALGMDFSAGMAVVSADLAMGSTAEQALDAVRLVMLVNRVLQRGAHGGTERATAFSPVALTPDELGVAWARGRVHLPLQCTLNARSFGQCDAGADMPLHFGDLLSAACQSRALRAGTILECAPVSNTPQQRKGQAIWPQGFASLAEKRAMEARKDGQSESAYLQPLDCVRVEMKQADGASLFGAIELALVAPPPPARPSRASTAAQTA